MSALVFSAVFGWAIIGYLVVELATAIGQGKVSFPLTLNMLSALAFALIAYAHYST